MAEGLHMTVDDDTSLAAMFKIQLASRQGQVAAAHAAAYPPTVDAANEELAWQHELQLAQLYRDGYKRDVMRSLVRSAITTAYHVYAAFGQTYFMEYTFSNPYNHEERFSIRVDDALDELRLVTDVREISLLRRTLPHACAHVGLPPHSATAAAALGRMETALLLSGREARDSRASAGGARSHEVQVLLLAGESITLSFVYVSLSAGEVNISGASGVCSQHALRQLGVAVSAGSATFDEAGGNSELVPSHPYWAAASRSASGVATMDCTPLGSTPAGAYTTRYSCAPPVAARAVPVNIVSTSHGQTAAMLTIHVHPRPFPVTATLHYYAAEFSLLKGSVPLPPAFLHARAGGIDSHVPSAFVRVPDGSVVVHLSEDASVAGGLVRRTLHFKYNVPAFPATGVFHILAYDDASCLRLRGCTRVVVHTAQACNIHCVCGQALTTDLLLQPPLAGYDARTTTSVRTSAGAGALSLPGSSAARRARIAVLPLAPNSDGIECASHALLVPGALNRVAIQLPPSHAAYRRALIQAVDADTREVLASWLVSALSAAPTVSRVYHTRVPASVAQVDKRI
ncbi:hypothetical protein EON66_07940, partial [archaeon]